MAYSIPTDNVLNLRDVDRETRISELLTFKAFEVSPVWQNIYNTSQGVFPIGDFNKDYIISRNYELGQEGIIKPDTAKTTLYGGSQLDAGAFTRFNDSLTDTAVWPDPKLSPSTKSIRFDIGMSAFLTNYNSTMGEALADADPRTIAKVLAGKDERFAITVTRNQAHYFWADQNDRYAFCQVENGESVAADTFVSAGSGAEAVYMFQTSNDAPSRFHEGMLIEFAFEAAQTAGGNANNQWDIAHPGVFAVVINVDRLENRVYCRFINESTMAAVTVDAVAALGGDSGTVSPVSIPEGSYVLPYGTISGSAAAGNTSHGMLGPNAFYKDSGNLLGDEAVSTGTVNVDVVSRMKSKKKAVNGSLTQQILTRALNNFNDAYRDQGHMLDTMVTTQGVVNEYLNNQAARRTEDVGGSAYTLANEGFDGRFSFQNGDQKFDIVVDPYVEAGALYGFKFANQNWKRACPADYGNFSSAPQIAQQIPFRFVAQAGGYPTNAVPISDTSGSYNKFTGNVQMPGIIRCQHFPEHPAGLKLTGLTEDREFQS